MAGCLLYVTASNYFNRCHLGSLFSVLKYVLMLACCMLPPTPTILFRQIAFKRRRVHANRLHFLEPFTETQYNLAWHYSHGHRFFFFPPIQPGWETEGDEKEHYYWDPEHLDLRSVERHVRLHQLASHVLGVMMMMLIMCGHAHTRRVFVVFFFFLWHHRNQLPTCIKLKWMLALDIPRQTY